MNVFFFYKKWSDCQNLQHVYRNLNATPYMTKYSGFGKL